MPEIPLAPDALPEPLRGPLERLAQRHRISAQVSTDSWTETYIVRLMPPDVGSTAGYTHEAIDRVVPEAIDAMLDRQVGHLHQNLLDEMPELQRMARAAMARELIDWMAGAPAVPGSELFHKLYEMGALS